MWSVWRIRRGIPKSPLRSISGEWHSHSARVCRLGKPRKMELRVYFPALIVQEPAGCKSDLTNSPLPFFFFFFFAVKKHGETGALLSFNTKVGEVGKRKSECSGTRIISPLPQLVPMMWKSSVWRNQTKRKIAKALVVAA